MDISAWRLVPPAPAGPVASAIGSIGVTPFTRGRRRKAFGGPNSDHLRRLKKLEKENERRRAGRIGEPSSPARRRACIGHVTRTFEVSERMARRVPGRRRQTRRKAPRGRVEDAALTADLVATATWRGRRRRRGTTAMLRAAGRAVDVRRDERIRRPEGLKAPGKRPKRGRRRLADGSRVRLRSDHVRSRDCVEDRPRDCRTFRMLDVVDAFTRVCPAIRIDRKPTSSTSCRTSASAAACRTVSVPMTAPGSPPGPCGNGPRPSGRRPPWSSSPARGRTTVASASTPGFAMHC